MDWTHLHGELLSQAFKHVLGQARPGSLAFARCLTPNVVEKLGVDRSFAPQGWDVSCVADHTDSKTRTITADKAVERRESKTDATLLLVDSAKAGAGMDGIYSAALEVGEATLFKQALRLAGGKVTKRHSASVRRYAERAIAMANRYRGPYAVSQWSAFDFLCRVAMNETPSPGSHLHLIGLWSIEDSDESDWEGDLQASRLFVDRLLGTAGARLAPSARIKTLNLDDESESAKGALERFLHSVDSKPLFTALAQLADKNDLWIGALRTKAPAQSLEDIELTVWRNRNGSIAKWSGLVEQDAEEPPALIFDPDADHNGKHSTLEVRWRTVPTDLEKNAAEYRVAVLTDMDEELASKIVRHAANKSGERCRFSDDDFSSLSVESRLYAKVSVSVLSSDTIEPQESEEFIIRYGERPESEPAGVGARVRTFSEGLVELRSREAVSSMASKPSAISDSKGFLVLRTSVVQGRRKSFRVYRPPLIKEVEEHWVALGGQVGRWMVKVRGSGSRAGELQFIRLGNGGGQEWSRTVMASQRMTTLFQNVGGVGQVYDEQASSFATVQEYLRAWAALLEKGNPALALANTVEVQSLSGRTIGLIVLPAHPLRMAWLAAYDNLVLHAAFELKQKPKDIREEFSGLDGAMFPAFLPNPQTDPQSGAFVFADTLGFHAVGMVPDSDKEPKAAVAILARALGDGESADTVPTVGEQSTKVLANEIVKYLECHERARLLHIHALRAGDGLTVARSLGGVRDHYSQGADENETEEPSGTAPVFSLNLYPSFEQRGIAGRFIAEAREKRRSGAGVLGAEDRWMLESLSLPGGVNMPRLRWACKAAKELGRSAEPNTAAHLAIAFDTFESHVVAEDESNSLAAYPYHAFGLLLFYERHYTSLPSPLWRSSTPPATVGEKHPSRRVHTEMLSRLQNAIQAAVVRQLGSESRRPILRTDITVEKADGLKDLHRLCDWVITLDRNAGIEYFDSPLDNRDIYDAYVIDCVPEREDLGCLQLITSTANLDEVRSLLDAALDQMGLSRSRRNAEFLMEHLKALSGRLAIRLTGQRPATSELIALAVSHANCRNVLPTDDCWVSLEDGFIVPVDDVQDLLPPLQDVEHRGQRTRPDLIYVSSRPRSGLTFRFIEVKYRRDLRSARSPDVLEHIDKQTQGLRKRWESWYGVDVCAPFRAIRRAKLARVLRFYADKAHRHYLPTRRHTELVTEINRMVAEGGNYALASAQMQDGDRGWVFCPEFVPHSPLLVSPHDWSTRIFLVGPSLLPNAQINASVGLGSPAGRSPAEARAKGEGNDDSLPNRPDGETESAGGAGSDLPIRAPVPAVSLGTDVLTNTEVDWSLAVKGNPHLLIAGLPGMGKTTCLINMCRQMVAADIRPIVFSYHQDIDDGVKQSARSVRFIDFDGLGFNPLRIANRESKTAHLDVAGEMRDIFAAIYPEIGDIQAGRIRRAIKESFVEAGWEESDARCDLEEPSFRRFVEILRSDQKPNPGLRRLLERLEELDDYGFFVSAESQPSLWESELPTVVRIHTTQNENLQRAFSSLVFYRLYKDMFRRGIQDRITHAVIFDEAHRAGRLKLIPTMAKECRKYGISLVLASQAAADFNSSLFSAIANYLILGMTDADARFLVRNVAGSHQERGLIDKIKQMEKFKALFFREGERRPRLMSLHSDEGGRILTAIRLYRKGNMSTGAVSELVGIPKSLLLTKLGEHDLDTFDMSGEELRRDLDSARRLL